MSKTFKVVRHADRGTGQTDVALGLTEDEAEAEVLYQQSFYKNHWDGKFTIEPDEVTS